MKKAKVILTAIAVLAIVGGALGFKAKRLPFRAYITNGITVTSYTSVGIIYTTIVPLCLHDGLFLGVGDIGNSYRLTLQILTGFAPNGLTRTWRELVCTPTVTLVTDDL